jgi:hypothetical protein
MSLGRVRCVAVAVVLLALPATRAAAQESDACSDSSCSAATQAAPSIQLDPDVAAVHSTKRPAALVPLYVSFVTLQILDLHSTHAALARGGAEANPVLSAFAGSTVAMSVVKAAGTAGVILASEKLRGKNRAAAIGLMIAANSAMAWVVEHNYRVGR